MTHVFAFVKRQFLGNLKHHFFLVAALFFIYFTVNLIVFDPDFGWHLRIGELILQTGVPKQDPFSYTMPSYPFVDHGFIGDILIALLYPKVGFVGLAAVSGFILTLAVLLSTTLALGKPNRTFVLLPLLLGSTSLLQFTWVRPQVLTLLLFSVLIFLLSDYRRFLRWRFALPILFLLWANIHGGFAIGLLVLAIATFVDLWERKRGAWLTLAILPISVFMTLINPYGVRLWGEVWMTISDREPRWSILEWTPTPFIFTFTMWILIVASVFLIFRYRKRFSLKALVLFVVTLLIGLSGIRHIPIWIIVAIPLTAQAIAYLLQEAAGKKAGRIRFKKAYRVFSIITGVAVILQLIFSYQGARLISDDVFYPKGAVIYLREHMPKGEIYSDYGWGGYLIWKLPEKKVFIDGRMVSWKWKAKSDGELSYAFGYFKDVGSGKIPFIDAVERFGIDTVLLPVASSNTKSWIDPIDRWLFEKLPFLKLDRAQPKIITQAKKLGWQKVYEDSVAIVFQKMP